VAWARRSDKEINLILSWSGHGRSIGKVPSEIWYDENNKPTWGYDVPMNEEPLRWFKLLLLRTEDLPPKFRKSEYFVRARDMMEKSGKTVQTLITDYLHLLWEHIMSEIKRELGPTVLNSLAIQVVITVPAIWKGYARQTMANAVERSGILDYRERGATKFSFVPEPEAAALATLLDQGSSVRPGNVYLICDAGGGTVVSSTLGSIIRTATDWQFRTSLATKSKARNPLSYMKRRRE
jgi:hypothetical protein